MAYIINTTILPKRRLTLWSINTHSINTLHWNGGSRTNYNVVGGSPDVWPAANLIIYVPIVVKQMVLVKKIWFGAGGTGTGNIDLGIYNRAGTRLVSSGTIAHGTGNNEKVVDITDLPLKPDLYYMALQGSNNTDTMYRENLAGPAPAAGGVRDEAAGGFGLPATATWVVDSALGYVPEMGIFVETTVS